MGQRKRKAIPSWDGRGMMAQCPTMLGQPRGLSASGWTTENSIRVASICGWTVTENQVAEVEREIHPKWYGQPITHEAGVEQAVRQSSTGSPGQT